MARSSWHRRRITSPRVGDRYYDNSEFGLGELLVFERYRDDTFEESVAFVKRWVLDRDMRGSSYSALA